MKPRSPYEDIAHAYLRLNNFLILSNFVIELNTKSRPGFEIDIIAYRPKGAVEYSIKTLTYNESIDSIFYGKFECDNEFIKKLSQLYEKTKSKTISESSIIKKYNIALIGDVKSYKYDLWNNKSHRSKEEKKSIMKIKIAYVLTLFGIKPNKKGKILQGITEKLVNQAFYIDDDQKIIILLAGFARRNRPSSGNKGIKASKGSLECRKSSLGISYLYIPLEHTISFICSRIRQYYDEKSRSRALYPNPSFSVLTLLDPKCHWESKK